MGNTPPSSPVLNSQSDMLSSSANLNTAQNNNQIPSTTLSATQKWIQFSPYSVLPLKAFKAGNDTDGTVIYVGRSFHNGDMLVLKFMPSKHAAYVSWHGEEIKKDYFELLCGDNFVWRPCNDHVIPQNALLCGTTKLGDPIYIGRGHYEGGLIVGKISTMHRALYVPYNGAERRLDTYEILVEEKSPQPGWSIPQSVMERKSKEADKLTELPAPPPYDAIFVSPQAPTKELPQPSAPSAPAIHPDWRPQSHSSVTLNQMQLQQPIAPERLMTPQQLNPPIHPMQSQQPTAPIQQRPSMRQYPTMSTNQQLQKPIFYAQPSVGSSSSRSKKFKPSLTFHPQVSMNSPNSAVEQDLYEVWTCGRTLKDAFCAGYDTDRTKLYICRAAHEGDLIPGKFVPTHRDAYISCNGEEVPKHHFETLTGAGRYHWVPDSNGNVPNGTVQGGRTADGEILYVGRARYKGSLTPGKVHCSHHCFYIPYGGKEKRFRNYEVLVRI